MSNIDEIEYAINILTKSGQDKNRISILHCNTEHLLLLFMMLISRAMKTIREKFSLPVGYSDHTMGVIVPISAVALGATIIEKHFTLDRNMDGPIKAASLEPNELKKNGNQ